MNTGLARYLTVPVTGSRTVVSFVTADLDDDAAAAVGDFLVDLDDRVRPNVLRLDFARLENVGSGGLSLLIALTRRMQQDGGHLQIINVAPSLYQLFRLFGLDELLSARARPAEVLAVA